MSSIATRAFTVALLGLASTALATPGKPPPVIHIELEQKQIGHRLVGSTLTQATAEPGGLQIGAGSTDWFLLGFKPGDVIVAENGSPVGERMYVSDGIYTFDVLRNKKPILIRVVVHPPLRRTKTIEEDRYDKLLALAKDTTDTRVVPLVGASGPSGVRVVDTLLGLYMDTEIGDIIRSIDGNTIHTDAQLTTAIENLRVGSTDLSIERRGRPMTLTLVRKAPLDLTQVTRQTATRYRVTRAFADAVLADTDILARKATVTPNIKNGRPHGFAIYEIQPDAPAGKLGLLDGDIVLDIDGHRIDSFSEVIDARTQLEGASSLEVHVERKGKPVTLVYSVAP